MIPAAVAVYRVVARRKPNDNRQACNVFADTYPGTELILIGVEEPQALIHAPNESVDPNELEAMALTEALFLQRYATIGSANMADH